MNHEPVTFSYDHAHKTVCVWFGYDNDKDHLAWIVAPDPTSGGYIVSDGEYGELYATWKLALTAFAEQIDITLDTLCASANVTLPDDE